MSGIRLQSLIFQPVRNTSILKRTSQ